MTTSIFGSGFRRSLAHIISTIAFIGMTIGSLWSQQNSEDLSKIHELYQNLKTYSVEVEQNVYTTYTSTQSIDRVSGSVRLGENKYYSLIDGIEILQNEEYTIMADHDDRTLLLQGKLPIMPVNLGMPPIDSLMDRCDKISFSKLSAESHVYDFYYSEETYSRVRMEYNPTSFHIDKVILYYGVADYWGGNEEASLARIELDFRNPKINEPLAASIFSVNRFFQSPTKQLRLQPAYVAFSLHNYLH